MMEIYTIGCFCLSDLFFVVLHILLEKSKLRSAEVPATPVLSEHDAMAT